AGKHKSRGELCILPHRSPIGDWRVRRQHGTPCTIDEPVSVMCPYLPRAATSCRMKQHCADAQSPDPTPIGVSPTPPVGIPGRGGAAGGCLPTEAVRCDVVRIGAK